MSHKNKFVEPDAPDPRKHAESILVRAGWERAEVAWLLPQLLQALAEDDPGADAETLLTERTKCALEELGRAKAQLSDTAAVLVFATHVFQKELWQAASPSQWDVLLREARDWGVPLTSGLAQLHHLALGDKVPPLLVPWKNLGAWELGFRLRALANRLASAGCLDFSALLRWDLPQGPEDHRRGWGSGMWPTDASTECASDPREPLFWMHALGEDAVRELVAQVVASPAHDFAPRALKLVQAFTDWMTNRELPGPQLVHFDYPALPPTSREEMGRLYVSAKQRLGDDSIGSAMSDALLLHLARIAFEGRSEHVPAEAARSILRLATDSLAKMRPLLRRANTPDALIEFSRLPAASLREDAVFMLFEFGTLWEAWKPLLLAFRALAVPSLSSGLSFRENAPNPWSIIPSSIVMMFHYRARREQEGDPTLKALRSEFGQFCLDSLKTLKPRKSRTGPVEKGDDTAQLREPSADWRYGYIRALLELRINPEGDGHHVLRWVGDNDPDEGVREVASKAYDEVRRGDRLGDMSPRRAILQAFWWLEQAHMLALGQSVDGPGAQRTREWMVRMTTEKSADRQEN